MNDAISERTGTACPDELPNAVECEVLPVFRASSSPKLPDAEVRQAVRLFFELLEHKLDDRSLDGAGPQIHDCLVRYFNAREYAKIAAHFELFGKFLLKLIRPARYADLAAKLRNRFVLSEVLKEFALSEESEMKVWTACPWEQFPPADLPGKPGFKEQVGWTYRFRNTEEHLGLERDRVREPLVFRSVCVCLVWLVAKSKREIQSALLRARFSDYLHRLRGDEKLAAMAAECVEPTARFRSAEEYRVSNPLLPLVKAPSAEEEFEVFGLPEANRVTVIEGEAGAGKTTALELLAWREAGRLLDGGNHEAPLPVYIRLVACHSTIAASVEQDLTAGHPRPAEVPWDSLLLLVDGLNQVSTEEQSKFQAEIQKLLQLHPGLRVMATGRLNSVRGEYPAAIVQLQPLSEGRLGELVGNVLQDVKRAAAIMATILRTPGLLALARTPFYAATLASLAKTENLAALTSRAAIVRACVRRFLDREDLQASAGINRTRRAKKESLLARLALDAKSAGESVFSRPRARVILEQAREELATGLDVLEFLEVARAGHAGIQ